jgi:hypothetical protein
VKSASLTDEDKDKIRAATEYWVEHDPTKRIQLLRGMRCQIRRAN